MRPYPSLSKDRLYRTIKHLRKLFSDWAFGPTLPVASATADENGCSIVGAIRSSAEALYVRDKAVDAGPRPQKVFEEANRTILFLCTIHGFRDAVSIKQQLSAWGEHDRALWVRGHTEAKR